MKTLAALSAFFLAFSFSAQATDRCLENASSEALLNEISKRLGGDTEPAPELQVSAKCDSWDIEVNLVDLYKGTESSAKLDGNNPTACRNLAKRINDRLGGKILNQSIIIANCKSWDVQRLLVSSRGELKRLADKEMSHPSECESEAERINSSW